MFLWRFLPEQPHTHTTKRVTFLTNTNITFIGWQDVGQAGTLKPPVWDTQNPVIQPLEIFSEYYQ